jgi:Mn2+/Fe2+ NRAMP family transporter
VCVPIAAVGVSALFLRGSFHRVEHVLLGLGTIFLTYIVSGFLAHPDWGAAAHGLLVPQLPLTPEAVVVATGTIGTTLAPWGLAFIQSYAADKHLSVRDLRYERWDVIAGAVMAGVIGFFVVVACAATLHETGRTVGDARDAAVALRPLAGHVASGLFAFGLLGAGLLAASVLPLSTAYSVSEAFGREAALDDPVRQAPFFYGTFAVVTIVGAGIVLVPEIPLVPILFVTQVVNAVLLLPLLVVMTRLGRDRELLGEHANGTAAHAFALAALALVALAVTALAVLGLVG